MTDATLTTTGWVPNLQWATEAGMVSAPVKLVAEPNGDGLRIMRLHDGSADQRLPTAMTRDGRLVFALLGGGEVLG